MVRNRRETQIETPESHQRPSGTSAGSETRTIQETQTQLQTSTEEELADLTEAQLDARIKAVEQTRRLQRKREYLAILDRGEIPSFNLEETRTLSTSPESIMSVPSPKRLRNESWGKVQLPLPAYTGKNWLELQAYLTDLESHFITQQEAFREDSQRVLYASTCLKGEMKRRWTSYVQATRQGDLQSITWNEYRNWLINSINDGPTRCLEATAKLARLEQRPRQKFRHFLDIYEAIEGELPEPLPETFRICTFIQKLVPPMKKQILSHGLPATWQALTHTGTIAETLLGQELEGNFVPKVNPENPQERRPSDIPTNQQRPSDEGARPPLQNNDDRPRKKRVICFRCGEPDHISTNCKAPACSLCASTRHTTARHGAPPVSGSNADPITARQQSA